MSLDSRLHPVREDSAARYLQDRIERNVYLDPYEKQCRVSRTTLQKEPSKNSSRLSELLFGDAVDVYEEHEGWAWVQSKKDQYVGYCDAKALGQLQLKTHYCLYPLIHVYDAPNFTLSPIGELYAGSEIEVSETVHSIRPTTPSIDFSHSPNLGWVVSSALSVTPLTRLGALSAIRKFLGVPYLWGGRSAYGIDCSGLAQLFYAYQRVSIPRDSDQQKQSDFFVAIQPNSTIELELGDLLFTPGHVVICVGGGMCVHAQATTMCVIEESISSLLERVSVDLVDATVRRPR